MLRSLRGQASKLTPCVSLLGPALVPDDIAEGALGEGLDAVDRLEMEQVLLDVGGQQQEV